MLKFLLLLFCFMISVSRASLRGADLLELEDYVPCFARYAPRLWNEVMNALPAVTRANVDQISLVYRWLRQSLASRHAPCDALKRALLPLAFKIMPLSDIQSAFDHCRLQWLIAADLVPQPGPFHICLSAGHHHAVTAIPRTRSEERMESANFIALAEVDSPEATTTFTGQYSDYKTQTIIQAIRWNIQHATQVNTSSIFVY